MLFNSIHFVLFLPVVFILYFSIPSKYRWPLLLAASYYFYMCWKVEYIVLIVTSTLIDYVAGLRIASTDSQRKKKIYLTLSIVSNLGILGGFKYFNFVSTSFRDLFQLFNIFYNTPTFDILLPVGISFYTFQSMSYTIDVYRGNRGPEKHLGIFALYVSFFPQLVAGPIERSTRLIPQLKKTNEFSYSDCVNGLKQILWGYFKKLVVADRAAIYVNAVFSNPDGHSGATVMLAAFMFGFQVYCDFSGYSDIAIGSARMMGYKLMTNFRRPYFSASLREFWARWHISLSTWFKDYLYIPLGGSRVGRLRWYGNILTTFVISGIWHGANWTFVFWGALHGLFLILEDYAQFVREKLGIPQLFDKNNRLIKFIKIIFTFSLVNFAAIFFRSSSIQDAFQLVSSLFNFSTSIWIPRNDNIATPAYALSAIALLLIVEMKQEYFNDKFTFFHNRNIIIRQLSYAALVVIIILGGVFDGGQFIYFEF